MSKRYVTVRWSKKDGVWNISGPGYEWSYHYTKVKAVEEGRWVAKRSSTELVVYNKDGRIAWRNSYGNDPRSRKG